MKILIKQAYFRVARGMGIVLVAAMLFTFGPVQNAQAAPAFFSITSQYFAPGQWVALGALPEDLNNVPTSNIKVLMDGHLLANVSSWNTLQVFVPSGFSYAHTFDVSITSKSGVITTDKKTLYLAQQPTLRADFVVTQYANGFNLRYPYGYDLWDYDNVKFSFTLDGEDLTGYYPIAPPIETLIQTEYMYPGEHELSLTIYVFNMTAEKSYYFNVSAKPRVVCYQKSGKSKAFAAKVCPAGWSKTKPVVRKLKCAKGLKSKVVYALACPAGYKRIR